MSEETVNIAAVLPKMAREMGDAPAIHFPEGKDAQGRRRYVTYTYAELDRQSSRIACGLEKVGIGRGVRTVLMVKPSLEFFALTFGIFKAGAVPVMVDPGMGLKNLKVCLAEAEPDAFIGIPAAHMARMALGWARGSLKTLVTVGRRLLWRGHTLEEIKRLAGDASDWKMASTAAEDVAAILFTSGSTGVPKGAVYTHGTFMAQVEAIRTMYDIAPGEIDLPTFPLFALFDPALGMTSVIPDMDFTKPASVDPTMVVEAVERFGVTNMFGSPALLNTVARHGRESGAKAKLPGLKRVISAGAPVPAAVMRGMLAMLDDDAHIVTPYGATESLPVATISSREVLAETAAKTDEGAGVCVGRPIEMTETVILKITDDPIETWSDDLRSEDGEVGEIAVRGPVVTHRYYNRDASTRLAKIRAEDGSIWHRMGDLGYFDEEGRLWFCGRKSHRVRTAHGDMYTVRCEAVFNTHPRVFRSALVGVGAPGSQRPVLCVELEPDCPQSEREPVRKALLELAKAHDHTQAIEQVLFHDGFPVDIRHNAKIGRPALAKWAANRGG